MKSYRSLAVGLALLGLCSLVGCSSNGPPSSGGNSGSSSANGDAKGAAGTPDNGKPTVAFVTNGIASFWVIAEKGAKDAGRDLGCNVEVRMPAADGAIGNQKQIVEELLAKKVAGIAISPIDPDNQTDLLNEAAAQTRLITQDADAPQSKRLAYIGMDNYEAGRQCGQLIKEALPKGGKIVLFVGRLEQLNARLRRQGVIDELLERTHDSKRYDEPSGEIKGEKYTILDTRTDNFDFAAAKALPEDALSRYPDVDCMVGLFAYNPPYILEAVRGAGKLGKIQIIGFDEDDATLQAIKDGHCYGTIVQNPYRYGYDSVKLLAEMAQGKPHELPESRFIDIPARAIKRDNVDDFWTELKRLTATDANPSSEAPAKAPAAKTKTPDGPPVKLAFVTNNASDFWKIAEAGVRRGEKEFNAECEVQLPANGTADDQQQIIEALMSRGVAGMAISPNDAENQVDIINRAAEVMAVITHDSDAPKSKRIAYVGTNNFKAGQAAGKLIKETLPNGGRIMLFVGRIDAQNALDRANGIKDVLKDSGIEVIDIRTDLTDRARAKQNVEDTINQYPDIGCLVGLWSYNGPAILEAVRDANKLGKTPIICFDEEDATLQGVADGHIRATVVQQPFEFGYQSVRVLAALARKQDASIPADKVVDVPVKVIRQESVKEFWDRLKRIKAGMGD